jgi:hypothetical protein
MARKARTENSEEPRTEKSEEPGYIPATWQQSGEVGLQFGTYLQIAKGAAPKTPLGSAGEAVGIAESVEGDANQAGLSKVGTVSFRRGRIWA